MEEPNETSTLMKRSSENLNDNTSRVKINLARLARASTTEERETIQILAVMESLILGSIEILLVE